MGKKGLVVKRLTFASIILIVSSCFLFLAVYVNHRPAFGLSPFDLHDAFTKLGSPGEDGFSINRDNLLSLLQNKGDSRLSQ